MRQSTSSPCRRGARSAAFRRSRSRASTTFPGTTTGPFRAVLERDTDLRAGVDSDLAFAREWAAHGSGYTIGEPADILSAEALALYERDPALEQPEHRPLAEQVARFWQEKGDLS